MRIAKPAAITRWNIFSNAVFRHTDKNCQGCLAEIIPFDTRTNRTISMRSINN